MLRWTQTLRHVRMTFRFRARLRGVKRMLGFSDLRLERAFVEAMKLVGGAFQPPRIQPHTVLYKWVIYTTRFLDSGLRVELLFQSLPTPKHLYTTLSLSQTHSITSLKRERSQAPRLLGITERKQETKCTRIRKGNRHSSKLIFLLEVTLCDIK